MKPFPWQEPHIQAAVRSLVKHRVFADTSDTGIGKTFMSLEVARRLGLRPVVVCPKSVITSWRDTVREMGLPTGAIVVGYEACRTGKYPVGEWKIKKRMWRWTLEEVPSVVIFDEAHRLKGATSQTSKLLTAAKRQGIHTLLLSATLCESPLDMKAIGFALGLHNLDHYRFWLRKVGVVRTEAGPQYRPTATMNMGVLRERMGDRIGGIRIADLGGQFPSRMVDTLRVPPAAIQHAHRSEYEAELEVLLAEAPTELVATIRNRQLAEVRMVGTLWDLAADTLESGASPVLFVNFRTTARLLAERLGWPDQLIIGEQSREERDLAVSRFQSGEAPVLVSTLSAGGTGINLPDPGGRPRVSFIVPGWSARELVQALGRTHRANAKSAAICHLVTLDGDETMDAVRGALRKKLSNIGAINDTDLRALVR